MAIAALVMVAAAELVEAAAAAEVDLVAGSAAATCLDMAKAAARRHQASQPPGRVSPVTAAPAAVEVVAAWLHMAGLARSCRVL
jgi:hypothetical protein